MEEEKSSTWNKVKGNVKEGVGRISKDRELAREGAKDQAVGRIKEGGLTSEREIRGEMDKLDRKERRL